MGAYSGKIRFLSILLLFSTTVFAFLPPVILNTRLYSYARMAVLGVLVLALVLSNWRRVFDDRFIRRASIMSLIIGVMLFAFYAFSFKVSWTDLVIISVSLVSMWVGYCMDFQEKEIRTLVFLFGGASVLLGLYTMYFFVGSLTLTNYMYVVDTKNMVGQIVAAGTVGLTIYTFSTKKNIGIFVLLALAVVLNVLLRCRTALVAYLLFVFFYMAITLSFKDAFGLFLLGVVLFAIFHERIITLLDSVFIGSFDVTDLDSVSAGRMQRNIDGLAFFFEHPLFGEMATSSDLPNIHNYVIKRMAAYGFFCIPFLVYYFYYLFFLINRWLKIKAKNDFSIYSVGLFMMIIPLFSSLLEPMSPFGPGLVQLIPFFFFGQYLRNKSMGIVPV